MEFFAILLLTYLDKQSRSAFSGAVLEAYVLSQNVITKRSQSQSHTRHCALSALCSDLMNQRTDEVCMANCSMHSQECELLDVCRSAVLILSTAQRRLTPETTKASARKAVVIQKDFWLVLVTSPRSITLCQICRLYCACLSGPGMPFDR